MTPQMLTAFMQFLFDRRKKGRRRQGFASRAAFGLSGLFASAVAFAMYLGVPPETIQGWLHGKAAVVLEKVGERIECKLDLPVAGGAIRCYFTAPPGDPADPGDPARACAGVIDAARQTLDVAGFEINNRVIIDALLRAQTRGVRVRVVTDTDYLDKSGPAAFRTAGIPVVDDQRSALMHNKFIVADGTSVWTGSMNFTENCAYKNDNNGVHVLVPAVAENYAVKFRWLFEQRAFGKRPARDARVPNPVVTLPDGTVLETYFAPHDECAEQLIRAIRDCRRSLDFLAFSFTHKGIGQAVADRAAAGVAVRGVFEKSQASNSYTRLHQLKQIGLPVYVDANPRNMHHKVMILDGSTTVTGSFNFSENADSSNDENLLVIRNSPSVAAQFEAEFERVYAPARAAGGK